MLLSRAAQAVFLLIGTDQHAQLLHHAQAPLPCASVAVPGVSKVVTVDVKGNWQRWLKVRDLTKGVTYFFRVQARTIAYGPELQANVTAGPAEGEWGCTGDCS